MRTLHLTSPLMRGTDVVEAQRLLKNAGFDPGPLDGEFGTLSAGAAKEAKWALGYAIEDVKPTFGSALYGYLTKTRKRPPVYLRRAKKRAKQASKTSVKVEKTLNYALSQLGIKEDPPNSNVTKYSRWYGMIGAWCAMFCSYCIEVGAKSGKFHYAYCPYVVNDAQAHRKLLSVVPDPARNTDTLVLALFDWDGGVADHVGFTLPESYLALHHAALLAKAKLRWGGLGPGDFWTCEGNTSPTNDSNGGEVWLRKRNRSQVEAFVKVAL